MGCCGQKRRALKAATPGLAPGGLVNVQYRLRGETRIHGRTGRTYVFSEERPIQPVHPLDARELLRSNGFRLV